MLNLMRKTILQYCSVLVIGVFAIMLASCTNDQNEKNGGVDCNCSIVQLLVAPEKYNQKRVRIIGLAMEADSQDGIGHVYLTKDDARFANDSNSVWIDYRDDAQSSSKTFGQFNGQFVVVVGTFAYRDGLMMIEKVTDIRALSPLPLDDSRFDPGI